MKDRIISVRKHAHLTQTEFGKCTGSTRSMIASYEGGKVAPDDTWIELVCLKFDVNKDWLRTGEGSMYIDHQSVTARLIQQHDFSALIGKLLDTYQQLPPEHQQVVLEYAHKVVASLAASPSSESDAPPPP